MRGTWGVREGDVTRESEMSKKMLPSGFEGGRSDQGPSRKGSIKKLGKNPKEMSPFLGSPEGLCYFKLLLLATCCSRQEKPPQLPRRLRGGAPSTVSLKLPPSLGSTGAGDSRNFLVPLPLLPPLVPVPGRAINPWL